MIKESAIIGFYFWVVSVLAGIFLGHEIALMSTRNKLEDKAKSYNSKLNNCHKLLTSEVYAKQ